MTPPAANLAVPGIARPLRPHPLFENHDARAMAHGNRLGVIGRRIVPNQTFERF